MQNKIWNKFILVLKWLVAVIFIFAGVSKILNPDVFARDIDNYRIFSYFLVTIIAIVLPWLEVLCGVFLIFGKWQKGAAVTLLILAFMFLVAISSAMARGLDITCGCFTMTTEVTKVGYLRLAEDMILFGIIILINFKILSKI